MIEIKYTYRSNKEALGKYLFSWKSVDILDILFGCILLSKMSKSKSSKILFPPGIFKFDKFIKP